MDRREYPGLGLTVFSAELPNGLRLVLAPRPGWRRSRACFVTRYGSADRRFTADGAAFSVPAGTAHYLEHKMFDMPGGSVDDVFAARGADANAYTSEAVTSYHFTCTGRFEEDLRTLLGFVSTPCFTPETVERERGIIGQEIAECEDDAGTAAYIGCMKLLFGDHPLGDMVVGTASSVAGVTAETLSACHRAFYVPANMVLCAAGDVDPEAAARIAAEMLPAEKAPLPAREYGPDPGLEPLEKRAKRTMDVSAPQFCAGAKLGPAVQGPDGLRERLTAELALRCLWGPSAPVYLDLYEKGLLNGEFHFEPTYAAGVGYITLEGESSDPEAALAGLLSAVEEALDPAYFDRQKKALYGGFVRMLDDFWELTESLADGCFAGFDALAVPDVLDGLSREAVTAWAREHLGPDRFALSVVRPKEERA